MELSLAEELLLIALKDKKGTVHLSASGGLTFGIAGAVLMDLYLDGRIKREGKRVIAAAGPASKDPVLGLLGPPEPAFPPKTKTSKPTKSKAGQ